jgi:uncharacterized protein YjbI with pentapeptide repeats
MNDMALKKQLMDKLKSSDKAVVAQAISTLRQQGWHSDGSLNGIDLRGANLRGAFMLAADMSEADLRGVDIRGADLLYTNLHRAKLDRADLSGADLSLANLHLATMREANLTDCFVGNTLFADVDLSEVIGLETVNHFSPSTIGIDTLYRSKGKIPEVFLRGCGIPEDFIRFAIAIANQPEVLFNTPQIFVSYSRQDWDKYVQPLVTHIRPLGFNTWVDQRLLVEGDDWLDKINEALEASKYMILCLSPNAVASKYVRMEYRYFFNNNKPIIPVICRHVDRLPAELQGIQYGVYDLETIADTLRTVMGDDAPPNL